MAFAFFSLGRKCWYCWAWRVGGPGPGQVVFIVHHPTLSEAFRLMVNRGCSLRPFLKWIIISPHHPHVEGEVVASCSTSSLRSVSSFSVMGPAAVELLINLMMWFYVSMVIRETWCPARWKDGVECFIALSSIPTWVSLFGLGPGAGQRIITGSVDPFSKLEGV